MLVSAMVGIDLRSTLDIDTTIKNLPLSADTVKEIICVWMEAEVSTEIKRSITVNSIILVGKWLQNYIDIRNTLLYNKK